MSPRTILITGSNRGLGLELVKQHAGLNPAPKVLLAACRNPDAAQELQNLAKQHSNIKIIQMDVANEESIQAAFKVSSDLLGTDGLHLLINNAGIAIEHNSICGVGVEDLLRMFRVNVVGPAIIVKTFLPLLRKAADEEAGELSWSRSAVINISSIVASIGGNTTGGFYQYRESKAALNQLTKNLSIELSPTGILVTCIHPGWVQTDMGGPNGTLTTQESVQALINLFQGMNKDSAGKLIDITGITLQW